MVNKDVYICTLSDQWQPSTMLYIPDEDNTTYFNIPGAPKIAV